MPKPEDQEEVVIEETDDKPGEGVEVDLNPPTEKAKDEPKYVTVHDLEAIRKQLNGLSSTNRHFSSVQKEIQELKAAINQSALSGKEKREKVDELDDMLEKGDWRTPVERMAEKVWERKNREFQEQQLRERASQERVSILEQNKQKVREKYPEIDNPNSEISRKYIDVRNRHQRFNFTEEGPLLAMYQMEEELREEGVLDKYTKKVVDKEVQRQIRTGATGAVRVANGTGSGNKIVLTQKQKEFCDSVGMKYQDYGKSLKNGSKTRETE